MVDVDGVISLLGFDLDMRPAGHFTTVGGILNFLSEEAARHLLDLRAEFDLVWCTGWEEAANDHLPYEIGLGPFPHLSARFSWARERGAPTLLVETDPAEGLVAAHAKRLRSWAAGL